MVKRRGKSIRKNTSKKKVIRKKRSIKRDLNKIDRKLASLGSVPIHVKEKAGYKEEVKLDRTVYRDHVLMTDFDKLLGLVNSKKEISFKEVAHTFGISLSLAEDWGKILEQGDLVRLYYSAFGRGKIVSLAEKEKKIKKHHSPFGKRMKFNLIFTVIAVVIVIVLILVLK